MLAAIWVEWLIDYYYMLVDDLPSSLATKSGFLLSDCGWIGVPATTLR